MPFCVPQPLYQGLSVYNDAIFYFKIIVKSLKVDSGHCCFENQSVFENDIIDMFCTGNLNDIKDAAKRMPTLNNDVLKSLQTMAAEASKAANMAVPHTQDSNPGNSI